MKRPENLHFGQIAVTVGLISLISLAVATRLSYSLIFLATIAGGVGVFYAVFPGSRFFAIAFANALAVYACIFIYLIEASFRTLDPEVRQVGFTLPIIAFLGGSWARRGQIRHLLEKKRSLSERHFGQVFFWLVPMVLIGASTFILAEVFASDAGLSTVFLATMGLTSLIVLWVSRDVCAFLLETGLVFEDFFRRIAGLVIPGFAFFTFYSLIVIIFGSIYRIVDRYTSGTHFLFAGEPHDLSFTECLYFSIITLSTVGYGDIVPASPAVRLIVGIEIVCGVLLLLFGFSEIIRYSREKAGGQS